MRCFGVVGCPIRVLFLLALVGGAPAVHADPQPWKQGVTPTQMKDAQHLLDEGNALAVEHEFTAALAKYQQAIAIWDHPAIRFNIVRCLIHLDRLVEASQNLELALKYGAAPLEEAVYNEAMAYQKLLADRVATVAVSCKQRGVEVTLDGQPLSTCPATLSRQVAPGRHQLVARGQGLLTRTFDVDAFGGKTETVAVDLVAPTASTHVTHRWASWFPWTTFIGGAALAAAGALLKYEAVGARDAYYAQLAHDCLVTPCPAGYAANLRDRAVLEDRVGIGALAIGTAALATGGFLLYLNRGRTVPATETPPISATVVPLPGGGGSFSVAGRF